MMRRSTLIVLVAAIVLVAGTLYWQRTRQGKVAGELEMPTPDSGKVSLFADQLGQQVTALVVEDAGGGSVAVRKGADGGWLVTRPTTAPADAAAVENVLGQLTTLQSVSRIPTTELVDLGLDPPAYRIWMQFDDGSEEILNVGKKSPTGSGYYVLTGGTDRGVYIVAGFGLENILNLIIAPPFLPPTLAPEATPEP